MNSFHDSFTPFGGGVALFNMMMGEVVPGGVGAGLYGILILAVITVFVGGLMVGRTPEYIGKKIRPTEMKYAALYILTMPTIVLVFAGLSLAFKVPRDSDPQPGAARPDRDHVRVHVDGQQQRVGVRRPRHGHDLVPGHRRHRHAARPVHRR